MSAPQSSSAGAAERLTVSAEGYRKLVLVSTITIVVIIVVGAAVRLTGSGLGCADWPNCSSSFIEFGSANQAMEQGNRILSGLGGIAAAALAAVGARRRRPYRKDLFWLSLGLMAGVFANIPLGGITVLVDLHPAAVGSHFVLGMVMLGLATILYWRASHAPGERTPAVGVVDVNLSRLMLVSAASLMLTGPLVTGSGPHAGDASARRFGFAIPDVVRIHSLNMWAFLICAVVVLGHVGMRQKADGVFRRGYVLLALILAQGFLGYAQYELGIPAWLVILHVLGAALVLIATVWFHLGLFVVPGDLTVRTDTYEDHSTLPVPEGARVTGTADTGTADTGTADTGTADTTAPRTAGEPAVTR